MKILNYGFLIKELDLIYLKVHPSNISAITVYEKAGFEIKGKQDDLICMNITKSKFIAAQNCKN
jgi:RimJ/RimL family protein N-acetyltransferase